MTPMTLNIADMQYAACTWGNPANPPVLALHGWLDNAASFDLLAPLLSDRYVVAIDLAGHGHTSHRPASGSYAIWADLLDLLAIADHFNWGTFDLIGHSRGAVISTLLSSVAPKRVSSLVLLDGLLPPPTTTNSTQQMQDYIRDERKFLKRNQANESDYAGPVFSLEGAIEARQKIMPICEKSARRIIERGTLAIKDGFRWRHDERLKGSSAVKLDQAHNESIISDLKVETLLLLTKENITSYPHVSGLIDLNERLTLQVVEGNHHFHMEEQLEQVASAVVEFFGNSIEKTKLTRMLQTSATDNE